METITIYRNTYRELVDKEFSQMMELATLKGRISAMADMEDNPKFVFDMLKEMKTEFGK